MTKAEIKVRLVKTKPKRSTTVVVLAASKGGVGKSTLAGALAARAMRDGAVAILDLDPQGSLAGFHERRGSPANPALIMLRGGLAGTIARVRSEGYAWLFIDTPPALMATIEAGVAVSDLVLIPVQSSAFDLEAVDAVVEMAAQAEKPFAFVLNRVEPKSKLTGSAVKFLKKGGRVLSQQVSNRESYRTAIITGKSGAEMRDATAEQEIDALWTAVKALAVEADEKAETRA